MSYSLLLERTIEGQEAALACQEQLANYIELAADLHGTKKLRNARLIVKTHRKTIADARAAVRLVREAALRGY